MRKPNRRDRFRKRESEAIATVIFLLALFALIFGSCSASEVKGAVHKVGTTSAAAGAAMIASGGNPVVGGAVLATTAAAELFIPTGKEDAIRETVEALSKDDAVALFAGRDEMKSESSFTRSIAFLALFGSLGYTYWRRRKAQGKYDLIDQLRDELKSLK